MGLATPFLQVFAKGLGQAPAPDFGFCSSPLSDAGPARIFPPAHKPRPPQMRDGGMVRGAPSGVKGACPAHAGCGMVGARKPWCRRSSGVEHALGKGGVVSSILTGGTTNPIDFKRFSRSGDSPVTAAIDEHGGNVWGGYGEGEGGDVRGTRGAKWEKLGKGKEGKCARNARERMGEVGGKGKLGGCARNARGRMGDIGGKGGNRGNVRGTRGS